MDLSMLGYRKVKVNTEWVISLLCMNGFSSGLIGPRSFLAMKLFFLSVWVVVG